MNRTTLNGLDQFTRAYMTAALWSSLDDDGEPLDQKYSVSDIEEKTARRMIEDCAKFQAEQAEHLAHSAMTAERQGHCFWLNRNGHGSGFGDAHSQVICDDYNREQALAVKTRDFTKRDALKQTCDCPYHVCLRLSDACKVYGEFTLSANPDAGYVYA